MMLFSGVMMFVAALNGHGNDTKSLPILITAVGGVLTLWAVYRIGYSKSDYDKLKKDRRNELDITRKALLLQLAETLLYAAVLSVGIILLVNESLTNKLLNLMAGGFTTLNGILGAVNAYKGRENKDFRWKLMLVLTAFELIVGPYFIFGSDAISINGYIIMGVLTSVAGIIEVISAVTRDNIRGTLNDGKEIVRIIKDAKSDSEEQSRS